MGAAVVALPTVTKHEATPVPRERRRRHVPSTEEEDDDDECRAAAPTAAAIDWDVEGATLLLGSLAKQSNNSGMETEVSAKVVLDDATAEGRGGITNKRKRSPASDSDCGSPGSHASKGALGLAGLHGEGSSSPAATRNAVEQPPTTAAAAAEPLPTTSAVQWECAALRQSAFKARNLPPASHGAAMAPSIPSLFLAVPDISQLSALLLLHQHQQRVAQQEQVIFRGRS
jgi:hypothetical protein